MDREAWRATVRGVARVGHDLATKPPSEGSDNKRRIQCAPGAAIPHNGAGEQVLKRKTKGRHLTKEFYSSVSAHEK